MVPPASCSKLQGYIKLKEKKEGTGRDRGSGGADGQTPTLLYAQHPVVARSARGNLFSETKGFWEKQQKGLVGVK